jgi:hypothetical protein
MIKKDKVEYEEAKPYEKYKKRKGMSSTLLSLVPAFFSLAITSVGLSIAINSLKSLEDDSHSIIGVPLGNARQV